MRLISIFDKTGSLGAITATMGCASCFPALAAFGSSLGLGFLAQFEGIFINTLLPAFAVLALLANVGGWFLHKNILRGIAGLAGPGMVLATLYLFWTDDWSTYMFYAGLVVMLAVSIWDIASPAQKSCTPAGTGTDGA
ncbi:MAG TPA: organomercurial transporter MerC [Gammaproteobacteria bacterium]|nr:organomercurial transporter MerC [Gammaproteobacteria bacterium]